MFLKPCKSWDKLPFPQLVNAGFLNHQQYVTKIIQIVLFFCLWLRFTESNPRWFFFDAFLRMLNRHGYVWIKDVAKEMLIYDIKAQGKLGWWNIIFCTLYFTFPVKFSGTHLLPENLGVADVSEGRVGEILESGQSLMVFFQPNSDMFFLKMKGFMSLEKCTISKRK